MKNKILTILLLFIPLVLYCPPDTKIFILRHEGYKPFEKVCFEQVWSAICFIESSGNAKAFNEKELARGIAQIRPCKIDDYNRLTGNNIGYEDVFCPELSRRIFMWHMEQYGVGRWEEGVKRWNGKGRMTEVYLEKVKKAIEHQNNNQYETF